MKKSNQDSSNIVYVITEESFDITLEVKFCEWSNKKSTTCFLLFDKTIVLITMF